MNTAYSGRFAEPPNWSFWTTCSYAFIMLVIGLPLWWKTTDVERSKLPYEQMFTLQDFLKDNLKVRLDVHLVGFRHSGSDITSNDNQVGEFVFPMYFSRNLTEEESLIIRTANDLYQLDAQLCSDRHENRMNIYSLSMTILQRRRIKLYNLMPVEHSPLNEVRVSYSRHVVIVRPSFDMGRASREIQTLFTVHDYARLRTFPNIVHRADFLHRIEKKIVFGNCLSVFFITSNPDQDYRSTKEDINALITASARASGTSSDVALSSGYDILFSLLVPEPEAVDAIWDIENAVKETIHPILKRLEFVADFSTRSQVLYYVKLNIHPELNNRTGNYDVRHEELSLVINPVESKLTSFVSQNPALNFLIYLPPCLIQPVQIVNADGSPVTSNGFYVPQWGAIQIYNGHCGLMNNTTPYYLSMKHILHVVISQFRALIGIPRMSADVSVLGLRTSGVRDWEINMLIRKRLMQLLFTSANTLKSLGNLLDQITNIVVREDVGREVWRSVTALKRSVEAAEAGNLDLALQEARIAYASSEIAFHHPSNLAQLYFPDDQKYAIYIPLFLPVGIPVLLSLRNIVSVINKVMRKL